MIYVVHCLDKPGHVAKRMELIDEHRAYLATKPVDILSSGPLLSEDGSEMIGSLFIVDAANRAEVEAFSAGDPFAKAETTWALSDEIKSGRRWTKPDPLIRTCGSLLSRENSLLHQLISLFRILGNSGLTH